MAMMYFPGELTLKNFLKIPYVKHGTMFKFERYPDQIYKVIEIDNSEPFCRPNIYKTIFNVAIGIPFPLETLSAMWEEPVEFYNYKREE